MPGDEAADNIGEAGKNQKPRRKEMDRPVPDRGTDDERNGKVNEGRVPMLPASPQYRRGWEMRMPMPLTNRPRTLSTTIQWVMRTTTRRRGASAAWPGASPLRLCKAPMRFW